MSRKRQRSNEGAAAAPPIPTPKSPGTLYFRYTPAPEEDDWRGTTTAPTNEPCLRPPPNSRGRHQREVDKVDIPAPAEWLCHDAAASTKLRAQAQTELQLFVPRRPSQLPHSERQELHIPYRDAGLVAAIKSTVGNSKSNAREMRPGRILCGGEVLPLGVWPARLRHHEGQSFYQDEGDEYGDGGDAGRPNYLVGGGSVGRSGALSGVGSVSEGSIHDELLRRQFPSSSASRSSAYQHQHQHQHPEESEVTRLLPDKRGRWAEVKQRRVPPTTAAAFPREIRAGSDASSGLPPPPPLPPPETPGTRPAPAAAADGADVVKCLIPSRFGGWVEFEEKVSDRARTPAEQRQRRRAAATRTGGFGPDSDGDVGIPDAALPSSYLEEEMYVRRMVSEAAVAAAAAAAREAEQRGRRENFLQPQEPEQEQERGARVGTTTNDTFGHSGGGGLGDGFGSWRNGVALESVEGTRIKANGDIVGGIKGRADGDTIDDIESSRARRGWTVSEPAKETVRRVWNRARRRARDSSDPSHRASRTSEDNHEDGPSAAGGGAIRDILDTGLLSCLGRECEGIIDAALHVVLGDRLRLLHQQSSSPVPPSSQEETQEAKPPPPPPPLLVTADWQDVLRAMRSCSDGARGVGKSAAVATVAPERDGDHQPTLTKPIAGRGGGNKGTSEAGVVDRGGRGEGGATAVPGRGEMERTVWGAGDSSDGSVVVVNERLPGLPLNEAVLTRAYNRLLMYLHEKKTWLA